MVNPKAIEEAKLSKPCPATGILFVPEGAVINNQIKNPQYRKIPITP